jgi:hypothetical protein
MLTIRWQILEHSLPAPLDIVGATVLRDCAFFAAALELLHPRLQYSIQIDTYLQVRTSRRVTRRECTEFQATIGDANQPGFRGRAPWDAHATQ